MKANRTARTFSTMEGLYLVRLFSECSAISAVKSLFLTAEYAEIAEKSERASWVNGQGIFLRRDIIFHGLFSASSAISAVNSFSSHRRARRVRREIRDEDSFRTCRLG